MNKTATIFVTMALVFACVSAWGDSLPGGGRGIYYGGMLHYISLNSNQHVAHYQGVVSPGHWGGPRGDGSSTSYLNLPKDWERQDPTDYGSGEGVVVFGGQMIHYAVVWNDKGAPWIVVSRYDLTAGTFIKDASGNMTATPLVAVPTSDHKKQGVAACVYDSKIYVFTGMFTLVSQDGINYSQISPIMSNLGPFNALDAITFYPDQGPPKIMVLFTNPNYQWLETFLLIWDGSSGLPLPSSAKIHTTNSDSFFVHNGALILGTVGTGSDSYPAGEKVPCVQVVTFGDDDSDHDHQKVQRHEYRIPSNSLVYGGNQYENNGYIENLRVYPWYEAQPPDSQGRTVLKQYIVINYAHCTDHDCPSANWHDTGLNSDFLVPQNKDSNNNGYGWQGTPTVTSQGTGDDASVLQKYWSLVGVILGPAPFATNGMEAFEINDFSNVEYGQDEDNKVEHKNTWSNTVMVGSDTEVKEGFSKMLSVTENLDVSYKHGWEGSHSTSTTCSAGTDLTMGSADESDGNWGDYGWAIFTVPTLLYQTNSIYAYDYDVSAGTGTYLQQQLPTVVQAAQLDDPGSPLSLNVNAFRFSLGTPGSTEDDVPGLMTGMQSFPNSTSLSEWGAQNWEASGSPWTILYGSGVGGGATVPVVKLGTESAPYFSSTTQTVDSTGSTNSVSVEAGVGIQSKIKIFGISETLKGGYDGEWSTETTSETDFSEKIVIHYKIPAVPSECQDSTCIRTLEVQPYLLMATDYTAPWVPAGYSLNKPWCITWRVTKAVNVDGQVIAPSPPPGSAGGTIVGGSGATETAEEMTAAQKGSKYSVEEGVLAWLEENGDLTPIPLTADQFNPALGASVRLNGHAFLADGTAGKWTRNGNIWKYKTKDSVKVDAFTLKLDFGKGSWGFEGSHLALSDHLRAGDRHARLDLAVNGMYTFTCDIDHHSKVDWKLKPSPSSAGLQVTHYSGTFASDSGEGELVLKGTLPEAMDGFGDLSFVANGFQKDIPLISSEAFQKAFQKQKELVVERKGIHLTVDFKKKTWSAHFSKAEFAPPMSPRWGGARLGVKVGGSAWYAQEHTVPDYTAKLSFKS